MTDLQPTPARAGAVRAVKPRAARARTPKMLVPAIAAFTVAGIALVAVAQSASPVSEAASVPSVDEISQAQSQAYSASLVTGEEAVADAAVVDDRGADATQVTVVTPEPKPVPEPAPEPSESTGGSTGDNTGGGDMPAADPGSAKAIAQQLLAAKGWGADQFNCLDTLYERESNWRVTAENPSSGAYGIPQSLPGNKMATHGSDWATNPATQIAWGLDYIEGRYGTPCGALGHSDSVGWY